MFDRVQISVKAGDGGSGAISFRREKFVPFGGPDGGDGGDGGDVMVRASLNVDSLIAFRRKRFFRAGNGGDGKSKKRHGKKGENLVVQVPPGTVVINKNQIGEDSIIADLVGVGEEVLVARGGKGGLGNVRFASSTNQAPQMALKGEIGEESLIILEIRLIADVGIIGYPNAGKSTLLTQLSRAQPKIAGYPFTTLEPILGVAEVDEQSLVVAEIPGLINDAHLGKGLGHDFLRHVLRTKILIHLVDGSLLNPVEAMLKVNNELHLFDSALVKKPQMVAVNKIDLPAVRARLDEIQDDFSGVGINAHFIAAATGEGVSQLIKATVKMLNEVKVKSEADEKITRKVFHPQAKDAGARVEREGDIFVIRVPESGLLFAKKDVAEQELKWQLERHLRRLGISRLLEKAGIKPGDRVRWGNFEWEWS